MLSIFGYSVLDDTCLEKGDRYISNFFWVLLAVGDDIPKSEIWCLCRVSQPKIVGPYAPTAGHQRAR
jgi:hypothetical protein